MPDMQTGVRLLDMGVVRPLRSQSICHGITASLSSKSDPVIILSRSNAPYFAVNPDVGLPYPLDLERAKKHSLMLIGKYMGSNSYIIEKHHLCLQIVLPLHTIETLALPDNYEDRRAFLFAPILEAVGVEDRQATFDAPADLVYNGKKLGILELDEFDNATILVAQISMDNDITMMCELPANSSIDMQQKLSTAYSTHTTSYKSEFDYVPTDEKIGASIIANVEAQWGLLAYPSFPTVEELDEVAEFDIELSLDYDAVPQSHESALIVPICAAVSVAQVTTTTLSGSAIGAVIYVVNGEIEGLMVSGELDNLTDEAMGNLADQALSTGLDRAAMIEKLTTLRGIETGPAADYSTNLASANNL